MVLPVVQDGPAAADGRGRPRRLPRGLAAAGLALPRGPRGEPGPGTPGRLEEAGEEGGEGAGPSPVDRGQAGPAIHPACDARAMPLGAVMAGANANDGVQAGGVLDARVARPPAGRRPPAAGAGDERSRPTVHADGAYQNRPTRDRIAAAGFRLRPIRRGGEGAGRVPQAVERCHNFLAQFGRLRVRLDRGRGRYLNWVEMAACIVFIRSGFVR